MGWLKCAKRLASLFSHLYSLSFALLISDDCLEDFSASQAYKKSSRLLTIAAVNVDTLHPIAHLVFEIFQNLIYVPDINNLEKTKTCIPYFYYPVFSTSDYVNSIVDSVTNFHTVDSAFVSVFIQDEMLARTVGSDFSLTGTENNV